MSSRTMNNLSRERINQLFAAARATSKEEPSQVQAAEFNWLEPHYFSAVQIENINKFTQMLAEAIGKKFADLNNCKFDVTIVSVTQHFAGEYIKDPQNSGSKNYYLPFAVDKQSPCGFVGIPEQTAFAWATQLLGDSKPEDDSSRDLSQLEESLLGDLAGAIVGIFSKTYKSTNFIPAGNIIKGYWPLNIQPDEEICKISFDVKKTDSEVNAGAYIIIPCSKFDAAAGKDAQKAVQHSAADVSKAITAHLHEMKLSVKAHLARASVTFEEMMSLQVDDILLLDRKVDEPVELIVGDRTVHYGRPARSEGQYALVIAENKGLLSK